MTRLIKMVALIITLGCILSTVGFLIPIANAHYGVSVDVETCKELNFSSDLKTIYLQGEPVIVRGKTENKSQTLNIYIVQDIDWRNGQTIPSRVPSTILTVTTDSQGLIQPVIAWNSASQGKYDIIVDTNNNGVYNPEKDALWDNEVGTSGFIVGTVVVTPEYMWGTGLALVTLFMALAVFTGFKRLSAKPATKTG